MAMLVVWLLSNTAFEMAGDLGLMGPTSAVIVSDTAINTECSKGDGFRHYCLRRYVLPPSILAPSCEGAADQLVAVFERLIAFKPS
jgi:hypothetical protein